MAKNIKIFFRILVLVLIPAFVVRPLVAYTQYGTLHSSAQQEYKTLSDGHSTNYIAFRIIERESPDVIVSNPQIVKLRISSHLKDFFNPIFAFAGSSLKSSRVLRI